MSFIIYVKFQEITDLDLNLIKNASSFQFDRQIELLSAAFYNARIHPSERLKRIEDPRNKACRRQDGNESLRAVAQSAEEKATYLRVE